jgi:hypothetical protein
MRPESFTHAQRIRRDLRWATIASAPCVLFLIYLMVAQGMTETWVGLVILGALWALVVWRFKGVGFKGLPPQR